MRSRVESHADIDGSLTVGIDGRRGPKTGPKGLPTPKGAVKSRRYIKETKRDSERAAGGPG